MALLNHADHIFWLGSSVTDLVVNLRGISNLLNESRRFAPRNVLLPVPLPEIDRSLTRAGARSKLGIPSDQFVFLTVGRAEKYHPCGPYSFFAMATEVLGRHRDAHLYVVGVRDDDPAVKVCDAVRARVHLLGSVEDPSPYWAAADLYVESFPFGSQTALLEAGACGLPVVPAFDPVFPLLVAHDDDVADLLPNPSTEGGVPQADRCARPPPGRPRRARVRAAGPPRPPGTPATAGWRTWPTRTVRRRPSRTARAASRATGCDETAVDTGLALWHALP